MSKSLVLNFHEYALCQNEEKRTQSLFCWNLNVCVMIKRLVYDEMIRIELEVARYKNLC